MGLHYHEKKWKRISMSKLLQAKSTLTERYQTTIPYLVRQTLGLEKGNKISYEIQTDGSVIISRCETQAQESDPILEKFLSFLSQDMSDNPQHCKAISSTTVDHLASLVGDIEVDLDAPLDNEEE